MLADLGRRCREEGVECDELLNQVGEEPGSRRILSWWQPSLGT